MVDQVIGHGGGAVMGLKPGAAADTVMGGFQQKPAADADKLDRPFLAGRKMEMHGWTQIGVTVLSRPWALR